jgi:hypothetical protein
MNAIMVALQGSRSETKKPHTGRHKLWSARVTGHFDFDLVSQYYWLLVMWLGEQHTGLPHTVNNQVASHLAQSTLQQLSLTGTPRTRCRLHCFKHDDTMTRSYA